MTDGHAMGFETGNPRLDTEQDPSEVITYLSRIDWGEDYPEELLVISDKEQDILDLHSQGLSFADMVEKEGGTNKKEKMLRIYHRAGVAKQELLMSRGVNIHDLGQDAKRILVCNDMFGADWLEKNPGVMERKISPMIKYVEFMDKTLGQRWRKYHRLWTYSPSSMQAKIDIYDKHLGPDWKINLDLLGSSVRTVLSSARALPHIGVTPETASTKSTYYNLLGTTLTNKQKKIVYIRRSILDHSQIRNSSQKRRISTLVARRARQTEADRATEAAELEELKIFIAYVGAGCLLKSNRTIASRAFNKGYAIR